MTKISVFGKQGCARCDTTKRKIGHFLDRWQLDHAVEMVFHDMDTLEGRAEGAFYDVQDVPMTLVEREGQEVARWDGRVPNSESIRAAIGEGANASAY